MLPPAAGAMVDVNDANPWCMGRRKLVQKRVQKSLKERVRGTWLMPLTRPMVLLLALRRRVNNSASADAALRGAGTCC